MNFAELAFGQAVNDAETWLARQYANAQTQKSSLIRIEGEDPDPEPLDINTAWDITSFTSSVGSLAMAAVGYVQFPGRDAEFDGLEYVRKMHPNWRENPDLTLAMKQGWFDLAYNPEQVEYRMHLAKGINDTLAESYRMTGMQTAMQFGAHLVGAPENLLMGMGLARAGYKGVTGLAALQKHWTLQVAAGASAGAAGNVGFQKIIEQINPSLNFDVDGYGDEGMAALFGAGFGGGMYAVGSAMRQAPRVAEFGSNKMHRFRLQRLEQAMDFVENEKMFTRQSGEKDTFIVAARESDQDLDGLLAAAGLEGVTTISPLVPRSMRNSMGKKITKLKQKAEDEGWTLQILRHPEQNVMDTFDQANAAMNNPAFNRIANQDQLGGDLIDKAFSAVTGPYAKMQSIVTPGARTAARQVGIIEDMYRTMSGSAHTITQASALRPFTNKKGATAEGYTQQLHKQAESLMTRLQSIYRSARRESKGTGLNYDGTMVDTGFVNGQTNFEVAVSDYLRRKHASEMGYTAEVPTDVHPSIWKPLSKQRATTK